MILTPNISNRNGRALEYKIVDFLCSKASGFSVQLTDQAINAQMRDKPNFEELDIKMKKSYLESAQLINDWLISLLSNQTIRIDRISDDQAKFGNPIDIAITSGTQQVNLSIKHNHFAIKHQRPEATAVQCGFKKGGVEDVNYRVAYNKIIDRFNKKVKAVLPNCVYFKELKAVDKNFISINLYRPVCELVTDAINSWCKQETHAKTLFQFLFGAIDYYKVIDLYDHVQIVKFSDWRFPKGAEAEVMRNSYVSVKFENNCIVSMRLHTASSRVGKSLKFDSQIKCIPTMERIPLKKNL